MLDSITGGGLLWVVIWMSLSRIEVWVNSLWRIEHLEAGSVLFCGSGSISSVSSIEPLDTSGPADIIDALLAGELFIGNSPGNSLRKKGLLLLFSSRGFFLPKKANGYILTGTAEIGRLRTD